MRTAYYMGGGPPIDWFVTASLLYDKVKIPLGPYQQDPSRYSQLHAVVPEEGVRHTYYHKICQNPKVDFLEDAAFTVDWPNGKDDLVSAIENANPGLDLYWSEVKPISVLQPIQAFLPIEPSKIDISKVLDFRAINNHRRIKFGLTADSLVKSLGEASTEEDARKALKYIEEELHDQYNRLKEVYTQTHIEAATQLITSFGAPPAIIGLASSVLHIACVDAASFVAGAGLTLATWLNTREKAKKRVSESEWAYLWDLKKLG